MRTKRGTLFFQVFLLCFIYSAQGQKTNNVWIFGDHVGLNFNTPTPSYIKNTKSNGTTPPYYISSICDSLGNLLFYTDGATTWDYTHKELPRYGRGWPLSAYSMPLICPYPAKDSFYYIFGISDNSNPYHLLYLTIQTYPPYSQIVYPQPYTPTNYFTVLNSNASLVLAGTGHCNQRDTWIVSYTPGAFNSFLVTNSGVSTNPVLSPVSTSIVPAGKLEVGFSNIKFSANSEKMVLPLVKENKMIVFSFNNLTGVLHDPVVLRAPPGMNLEDIELSPDGSKLYFGAWKLGDPDIFPQLHYIFQMDLDKPSVQEVEQSLYYLSDYPDRELCGPHVCWFVDRTLQLGPDGRIYVSSRYSDVVALDKTLSVINAPDNRGIDVLYRADAVNVNRMYKFLNYNYIRSNSFSLRENGIQIQKGTCADKPALFSLLYRNGVDSVKWNFGDPGSGSNNFSTSFNPSHFYPGPGNYPAEAIIYKTCITDTARKIVTVLADNAAHVPDFIRDTTVCVGNTLNYNATTPYAKIYAWENGYKYPNRNIDQAGHYEIFVMNDCSVDRKSFNVEFKECPCNTFIPSAFTPNYDGLNDSFKPVVQCFTKQYRLQIFSRYGDVLFETTDSEKGWGGKINGQDAASGVYVWLLQYRNPNSQGLITQKGTVTLIR